MTQDDYGYWHDRLGGSDRPLTPGDPGCGFWRYQVSGGEWIGIAVWRSGSGEIVATRHRAGEAGGTVIDASEAHRYAWKHPVTEDVFFRACTEGGRWPDDIGPGHNAPDSAASLADEVESAIAAALAEIKGGIGDQTRADRAANFKNRLGEIQKKVEAEHKVRKAPVLKEGRAIDAEYKPLVEKLTVAAATLRSALTAYMRKIDEAARAAAPEAVEIKVQAGTQGAHKVALRTVRAAEITDWPKAVLGFVDHADLREMVQRLANAQARAGVAEGDGWKARETKVAA